MNMSRNLCDGCAGAKGASYVVIEYEGGVEGAVHVSILVSERQINKRKEAWQTVFQVMKAKPPQCSFGLGAIHPIRRHTKAAIFVIAPGIEARAQAGQWGLVCQAQSKAISGYSWERVPWAKKGRKVASIGRYKTVYALPNCLCISLSNNRTEGEENVLCSNDCYEDGFHFAFACLLNNNIVMTVGGYEGEALYVWPQCSLRMVAWTLWLVQERTSESESHQSRPGLP